MGTFRIITQLRHLFVHTVSISPWTGQNVYGEAIYGAAVAYRARIQTMNVMQRGANQALADTVKVFLSEYVQVDPRDKVVISSDYGSRNDAGIFESPTSKLIEVQYLSDTKGPVCTVLICGRIGG
jgi:hypothetical protein